MAEDSDRDNALFVNLVLIFQSAAMQQMGKIINPLTGKIDRNLEQARFSIDTLSMLREKTKGNLSSDIERLLDSALLQLRMNFVDESRSAAESPSATDESRSAEEPQSAADSGSEESQTEAGAGSSSGGGGTHSGDAKAPAEKPAESEGARPAEPRSEPVGTKRPRASGPSQAGKARRKGRAGGGGGTQEAANR